MAPSRRPDVARAEPHSPRRKWWAILLATLLLVPGYWSLLAGLVSVATDKENSPNSGPFIVFGLPLTLLVFKAQNFLSKHLGGRPR